MPHVAEYASSGRAKCRGCDQKIAKGELRFGERQPNAFGDGEMTLWFHAPCAAFKRPEPYLEFLEPEDWGSLNDDDVATLKELEPTAEFGVRYRRVPRVDAASPAPTGRARCRSCKELIEKGSWRIGLVFFEEYRFQPSGFIHLNCAKTYFGTADIMARISHFSTSLGQHDLDDIAAQLG